MLKEIESADPLLSWDGDDLLLWNYPVSREAEVQAKREAGREGGRKSGEARQRSTASSTASISPSSPPSTEVERKGIGIGSGKERNGAASPPVHFSNTVMPDLPTWLQRVSPENEWEVEWWSQTFRREAGAGWKMKSGRQIEDWCLRQDSFVGFFQSAKREKDSKSSLPDSKAFENERLAEVARRETVEKELQAEMRAALKGARE